MRFIHVGNSPIARSGKASNNEDRSSSLGTSCELRSLKLHQRLSCDAYFSLWVWFLKPRRKKQRFGPVTGFQLIYGNRGKYAITYHEFKNTISHARVAHDQRIGGYAATDCLDGDAGKIDAALVDQFRDSAKEGLPEWVYLCVMRVLAGATRDSR